MTTPITVFRLRGVDYEFEIFQSDERLNWKPDPDFPHAQRACSTPLFELKILLLNSDGYTDQIEDLTLDDLLALREVIDAAIGANAALLSPRLDAEEEELSAALDSHAVRGAGQPCCEECEEPYPTHWMPLTDGVEGPNPYLCPDCAVSERGS